jgi:hypothetical protein
VGSASPQHFSIPMQLQSRIFSRWSKAACRLRHNLLQFKSPSKTTDLDDTVLHVPIAEDARPNVTACFLHAANASMQKRNVNTTSKHFPSHLPGIRADGSSRSPSVAFTVTLQHQLKAYQERFEQLRKVRDDERDVLLSKPISAGTLRGGKARASISDLGSIEQHLESETNNAISTPAEIDGIPEETSIGADGQVYFYGATSLYRVDPQPPSQDGAQNSTDSVSPWSGANQDPDSRHDERNEMRAFINEIAPAHLQELLEAYWCWPHHLHCVLCKRLFLRTLSHRKARL